LVLDVLRIEKAHIVGLSMAICPHLVLLIRVRRPSSSRVEMARPGSAPNLREAEASAKRSEEPLMKRQQATLGPTRVQHQNKDPRGWRNSPTNCRTLTEGAAPTMAA
jgi:hypothetical protein